MLSTSNLPVSNNQAKTFGPGNQELKINSIELVKGFDENSYRIILHMEGIDLGEGFEGFYKDNEAKTDRYLGQVGRVKLSQYDFKNGTTRTGIVIDRDQSILRSLQNLAKVTGVEEELAAVKADTMIEYIPLASEVFKNSRYANFCIAGQEFTNKAGYTQYNLFLPNSKNGKYAFTALLEDDSKLLEFDPKVHIISQKTTNVESFDASAKKDAFSL